MKLYVTYGFGSNLKNCYSVVEGADIATCYVIINEVTQGQYAFAYTEEHFAGQVEKYGLTEVPLQEQRKPDEPVLKQFNVTIRAKVTKTLLILADTPEEAQEIAHQEFSTVCDGDEHYEEDTLDITEVK